MTDSWMGLQPYIGSNAPKTLLEAVTAHSPRLSVISSDKGEKFASGLLAAVLTQTVELLSFAFTPQMIKAAADGILDRFGDVKVSELLIFKKMVSTGQIGGKLYRLDARVLVELFAEYYEQRSYEVEQIIQRKQDEWRRMDTMPTAEQIQKAYKEIKSEKPVIKKTKSVDASVLIEAEKWRTCHHEFENGTCVQCGCIL